MKNFADGVRGYLFQGRFGSCVLDETHLLAAARYGSGVRLAKFAQACCLAPHSSCRSQLTQTTQV
jgi:hypothetical protein